ncbi:MAG: plastocyanin/azurin family copper-binding protein [Saprospiraceae bacterium]
MNKFSLLLAFLILAFTTKAQLVVSELSYNPPESGTDSLEYIELRNVGNQPLHLLNYKFTRGIEFTFPDLTLAKDSFLVLAGNLGAFQNVFNKPAIQWNSGAFSNGGERVTITDSLANVVIDFTYANVAPWPSSSDGTNGEGRSIELCGPGADPNVGSNWKVSENDIMLIINGRSVYGTPGSTNSIAPCVPVADFIVEVSDFQFSPKDITINVGQTVRWENKGGAHNVNGTKTTFPNNPAGFTSGAVSSSNWILDVSFNTPGKYDYQCDQHVAQGMTGTVTVIEEVVVDPYPLRTIVSLTTVDGSGVCDSLNVSCTVVGIVYGGNLRQGGLQFTLIDNQNNGIGMFNGSNSLGYTVVEGDRVEIKGIVTQFRGLTQMNIDEIKLLEQNQTLVSAKEVNLFTENDESSLLIVKNVSFVDKNQWTTGMGAGFNVDMTNGQSVFSIRIDNDVDLYSLPAPDGNKFNVTGLLSQFSPNAQPPFEGGYQLLPRYMDDFAKVTSTYNGQILNLKVYPNPSMDFIQIGQDISIDEIQIFTVEGKEVFKSYSAEKIDISGLTPGVFKIVVKEGKNTHLTTFIKF